MEAGSTAWMAWDFSIVSNTDAPGLAALDVPDDEGSADRAASRRSVDTNWLHP
jgi:hypothetical protein